RHGLPYRGLGREGLFEGLFRRPASPPSQPNIRRQRIGRGPRREQRPRDRPRAHSRNQYRRRQDSGEFPRSLFQRVRRQAAPRRQRILLFSRPAAGNETAGFGSARPLMPNDFSWMERAAFIVASGMEVVMLLVLVIGAVRAIKTIAGHVLRRQPLASDVREIWMHFAGWIV